MKRKGIVNFFSELSESEKKIFHKPCINLHNNDKD